MAKVTITFLLGLMCAMVLISTPKKHTKTRLVCDKAAKYPKKKEKKCFEECRNKDAYDNRNKAYEKLTTKHKPVVDKWLKKYCKYLKKYYMCRVQCGGSVGRIACNNAFVYDRHKHYKGLIEKFPKKAKKMFDKCLPELKKEATKVPPNKSAVCDKAFKYKTQKKENECSYSCDNDNYVKEQEMFDKLDEKSHGKKPKKVAKWAKEYCSYLKSDYQCKVKCGGLVARYICNLAFHLKEDTSDYQKLIHKLPKKAKDAKKILKKYPSKLEEVVSGAAVLYEIQHKGLFYTDVAMTAVVLQSLFLVY